MEEKRKLQVPEEYLEDAIAALHGIVLKEEAKDADRIAAAKLLLGMGETEDGREALEVVMEVPKEFLV